MEPTRHTVTNMELIATIQALRSLRLTMDTTLDSKSIDFFKTS